MWSHCRPSWSLSGPSLVAEIHCLVVLTYRRFEYMIDNIIMILKATKNGEDIDPKVLVEQCHPLGRFDVSYL